MIFGGKELVVGDENEEEENEFIIDFRLSISVFPHLIVNIINLILSRFVKSTCWERKSD